MNFGIKKRENTNSSDLDVFRKGISNLFDDFFSLKPTGFFDSDWAPAIDVHEDNKGIYVKADMPGIDEKNLDVSIENNILSIKGEKSEERREGDGKRSIIVERKHGSFQRSIRLPEGIKSNEVKADFKNGVLTLTVPKAKVEEPKKIRIDVK